MTVPPGWGHPAAPGPGAGAVPHCYRHPDRETYVSCTRCGRPICPDCMREASVGYQCVECARAGARSVPATRTVFGGLVPQRPGRVTIGFIAACSTVFVVQVALAGIANPAASAFFRRFAMLGAALYPDGTQAVHGVAGGEYYRLITAAFLHVSVLHILFNMYALWVTGPQLEAAFGHLRFSVLYVYSALGGSVLTYLLANPRTLSAGASTAIFGLFGATGVVAARLRLSLQPIIVLIGVNLVITFTVPGISWTGHLGGLAVGGALGAAYAYTPRRYQAAMAWAAPIALGLLMAGAVAYRTHALLG